MGCQTEIAAKIIDKEADYVLALKGNQGTLQRRRGAVLHRAESPQIQGHRDRRHQTLEKSHGRIETRTDTAIGDIDWLTSSHTAGRASPAS